MVATVAGDILAWLLFAGIAIVGVTLTVVGTIRAHHCARTRRLSPAVSTALAGAAAILLFLGGWMFLGLYWLGVWMQRIARGAHAN
jgi:hypothetical protein